MCKPYCAFCLKTVYLFIFGCAGSLLVWAFSSCSEWGQLSSCGAQSSHCGGFSCYRAQALGHTGFSSCDVWVWLPHACEIFLDSGSNLCSLHWQVDFSPLDPQGSPDCIFLRENDWLWYSFFPSPLTGMEVAVTQLQPCRWARLLECVGVKIWKNTNPVRTHGAELLVQTGWTVTLEKDECFCLFFLNFLKILLLHISLCPELYKRA